MTRTYARSGIVTALLCASVLQSPAVASGVAVVTEADADDDGDNIVVTARKVREPLLTVPASVSVATAASMDAARVRSFADLAGIMPNVAFSGGIGGQLQGQIAIRGIATLVRNIGVESGIGVFVDGVYIGRPETFNQELLDVDQVEVLRGPQGTLFGKNTIAGVFNISSADPTGTLEGFARMEGGSHGLVRAQGAVSGPLAGDTLTARLAIGYASRGGFSEHVSGGRDADDLSLFSWRGALSFKPSEQFSVIFRTDGLRDRSVPGFFSATDLAIPAPSAPMSVREVDGNRPNRLRRDVAGGSLTASLSVGAAEITSVTAYRQSRYAASVDDDQRQADLLAVDDFGDRSEIWSQEIRVSGKAADDISYIAGVYGLDQRTSTDRALSVGSGLGIAGEPRLTTRGRVTTRSYAAFGNVDWRIVQAVTVSVGVRYTNESKTARFVQDDETGIFTLLGLPDVTFAGRSKDNDVSPTVAISYAPSDAIRVYGRAARGFKSAAFNVDLASSPNGLTAGPERATTYEAGIRADLLSRRLLVALTGFHTAYEDLQVAQITGVGTLLSNAGSAKIDGFEAEVTYRPATGMRLEGAAGYANARYGRFDACGVPLSEGGGATNCAGRQLVGAPKFTGRAAFEYRHGTSFGSVTARVEANHQSSVFFDPTNSERFRGRGRTLSNARLSVQLGALGGSLWIENVTNETYETYRDDRSAVGVLRTTAYGAPRTYGLTLSANF